LLRVTGGGAAAKLGVERAGAGDQEGGGEGGKVLEVSCAGLAGVYAGDLAAHPHRLARDADDASGLGHSQVAIGDFAQDAFVVRGHALTVVHLGQGQQRTRYGSVILT
jgi:hypothetical protein